MMYYNAFPWFMFLIIGGGILFFVCLLLVVFYVTRSANEKVPQVKNERYLQELKLTFAQGKIDEEEYHRRKKILEDE